MFIVFGAAASSASRTAIIAAHLYKREWKRKTITPKKNPSESYWRALLFFSLFVGCGGSVPGAVATGRLRMGRFERTRPLPLPVPHRFMF
jgi:hypothetical protein